MYDHRKKHNHGFTLVELAIVLVIIGFIIGGIASAASLLHSSRINSIVRDFAKYQRATNAFMLKFDGAVPGDMRNATDIWGADVQNGNGNRAICSGVPGAFYSISYTEIIGFFEHLQRAGLIEGSYSGEGDREIGVNLPVTRIPQTTFYADCLLDANTYFSPTSPPAQHIGKNTIFEFRKIDNDESASLAPKDAYLIDKKIDDGYPGRGSVLGAPTSNDSSNANLCSTGTNRLSDRYLISETEVTCRIGRILSFD